MSGMAINYTYVSPAVISANGASNSHWQKSAETVMAEMRQSLLSAEAELDEAETELAVLQDKYRRLQKLAYRLTVEGGTVDNEEWDEFLAPYEEAELNG